MNSSPALAIHISNRKIYVNGEEIAWLRLIDDTIEVCQDADGNAWLPVALQLDKGGALTYGPTTLTSGPQES